MENASEHTREFKVVKRIKLSVDEPAGVARRAWPIRRGIPFFDGELPRNAPVRIVSEKGQTLPTQSLSLTTWADDLKFVKWLLVDFQIDLEPGSERTVYLEYGPGLDVALPEPAVTVEGIDRGWRIDTGVMQVDLDRDCADFLASCKVMTSKGWKDVFGGPAGIYLYMTDQGAVSYDSLKAAPAPTITIEDAGPLRASVCVRGYHASQDGRRFCPYIVRIDFFAGKADMRFSHTFVFDQDPERIELSEIGVRLPFDPGDRSEMAFGGSNTSGPHRSNRFDRAEFIQSSDIAYCVQVDGKRIAEGEKTSGWASLSGENGSAVVIIRDHWQEYPKGIAIDGNGIDVQIWPKAYGRPLKFSTAFKEDALRFDDMDPRDEAEFARRVRSRPTAPLNLKSLGAETPEELLRVERMVAKYAPDRPASYNDTGTCNGFAAAKTTEFLLRLSAEPISAESAQDLAACVQAPVLASTDIEYACATSAMRTVAAFDPVRFPESEELLDDLFERIVVEPRRVLRTYGMIDYGDLMCSHSASPPAMWAHFKDQPDIVEKMKHCARSYNNEANDQLYALWILFVHSPKRKYFEAAEAYGRHIADVDMIHAQPDGSRGGLIHYHNCHHWTGGGSPSHTTLAGLMLQYYLTGNRRILDVCREAADWVWANQEPCGIFSNREGALVREYTTPIANLLEVYQATWEDRYGDLARRSLKWLLLAMPKPGCFPVSIYTAGDRGDEAEVEQTGWHMRQAGGMTPQLLYDAVRVFGDREPIFKDALLALADRYLRGRDEPLTEVLLVGPDKIRLQDPYFNASLIAYAYELTEDPAYAAYCRYYLREHFPQKGRQTSSTSFTSFTYVCWGSIIPPMMEAARRGEVKCGCSELDRIEQAWIQQLAGSIEVRSASPTRPPRRCIGKITGYR